MKLGPVMVMACALALFGCAGENDERDSMGSHLYQPPAGTRRPPPVDAGDVAIVGQEVAQAILQLPSIASASTPPLVRFNGVTSIINPPIDTNPYTDLLRDRLLLLTREKLRFVEHTLPPYVPGGHHKHVEASSDESGAQYQVLAEMRGQATADSYKIQVEFVDLGSGSVLFNQTYRIAKEAGQQPSADEYTPPMAAPQSPSPAPRQQPTDSAETGEQHSPPPGYYEPPATNTPTGSGNNGVL